jgi:Tol biopolymer transport system component
VTIWRRSGEGDRIIFNSNRSGSYQLFERSTLAGSEEKLVAPFAGGTATDWSRDGTIVLAQRRDALRNSSILDGSAHAGPAPTSLVDTEAEEREAQFSPNERWFAYSSTESGISQIYVRPFPGPGTTVMISVHGGAQPRWRADGKELFFIALDGRLMAVPITLPAGDGSPEAGTPRGLFVTKIGGALQPASKAQYLASDDGSRFLMNTILDRPAASPITLILNWKPPQQDQ